MNVADQPTPYLKAQAIVADERNWTPIELQVATVQALLAISNQLGAVVAALESLQ
jgi:hypothetical protein